MYIGSGNDYLTNATIHYNSTPEPTTEPSAEPTTEPTTASTKIPLTTVKIERTDTAADTAYSFYVDAADKYENCYVYAAVYDEKEH